MKIFLNQHNRLACFTAVLAAWLLTCLPPEAHAKGNMMSIKIEDYFSGKPLELAKAAGRGDASKIETLIKSGVDPNTFGRDGITALMWALGNQSKAGVRSLLKFGADPNLRDHKGRNPMIFAAEISDPNFLKLLLDAGGDPNTINTIGESLLRVAALGGSTDKVRLLVESGANMDSVDRSNSTVILLLSRLNDFRAVLFLLERGADYTIGDNSGGTAPEYIFNATINPKQFPESYEALQKCRQFLEAHGVKNPGMPGPTKEQVEERNRMIREAFEKKRRLQGRQ